MNKQLQDNVAIVTGASNGIGRVIANVCRGGGQTVLVARRSELLNEVATQ
jgi:NADP-dependent 3-hydroxy acid dehydrogenase YdfG